jgi:hypothetical protein
VGIDASINPEWELLRFSKPLECSAEVLSLPRDGGAPLESLSKLCIRPADITRTQCGQRHCDRDRRGERPPV